MHNLKLSHLGWQTHGAPAVAEAVEEYNTKQEEDQRATKQTAVWSIQWLQSYIITAHKLIELYTSALTYKYYT